MGFFAVSMGRILAPLNAYRYVMFSLVGKGCGIMESFH